MGRLVKRKDGSEKCPHCGTVFAPESMHPFDMQYREEARKRRSRAAKRGWKRRRAIENAPDRDRGIYH
jgi:uncharacterized Zn finger protein (UPF0148 family)